MRIAFALALLAAVSAACDFASPVVPVTGPNGQYGYLQVSCPGDVQRCRDLAAKSCPHGYEVVDRRGDASRYTSMSGLDDAEGAPGENGGMLVACK
jgi:hypothetical protein